jgi:hypothetical protein
MDSFVSFGLRQAYSKLAKLGDPLAEANTLIDWEIGQSKMAYMITRLRREDIPTSILC